MDFQKTTVSLRTRSLVFFVLAAAVVAVAGFLAVTVGVGVVAVACLALGVGLAVGGVRDRKKLSAGETTVDTGKPLGQRIAVVAVGAVLCGGFLLLMFSM